MKNHLSRKRPRRVPHGAPRQGSTLILVIALLGLLAMTGTVFFTFASQERSAAEYFVESAKAERADVDDPLPKELEQSVSKASDPISSGNLQ